ncbi:MAG: fructose-bisphosphate aldolase class I [bacterium]|nr:fructose-bisphosphate aldolase class I [bacterium]
MALKELESIARTMVPKGKGILAADESNSTLQKRFDSIQIQSTEETRRAYREMLFTTPGMEAFISGVILYDETLRSSAADGTPFPELLASKSVIPGIKVDEGLLDLAGFPGEKITQGLDGLAERLKEYYELGARFAKWRAVITIGQEIPSLACIRANAHALARYAAACQAQGVVPIVEPEVLMEGEHTIERCEQVTETTLRCVFDELLTMRVHLEGIVLKPSMVLAGTDCPVQAGVEEVAEATVRCFQRTVPSAVPGIAFLSGGQSPELSTAHLSAMNALGDHPWELSFSYGRALQDPARAAWKGKVGNVAAAQNVFYHRASCNGAARYGKYSAAMEAAA